jgi:hypothetical protein
MRNQIQRAVLLFLFGLIISCNKGNDPIPSVLSVCLPTALQTGVIAFYPFTTGSLADASGNSYNLTNTTSAAPGADRSGNPTCAFNFVKANGEFLKFTNPTFVDNFQTSPFSISIWYKPLGTRGAGDYELLIGRDVSPRCPDNYGQWAVGLYDCRRAVFAINQYSIWDNYFNPAGCSQTISSLSNVWSHLVVTCTGTSLKIYRNGVLTTALPNTGCTTNLPTLNIGDLFFGKDYTGMLDDVIIYNRVLSQAEITQLYSLAACCQ